MPETYARRMAAEGFTVLTFDFAGFGESGGTPRVTEMPMRKVGDIIAATQFLSSLACVEGSRVGFLAICASSMYAAIAVERGAPIAAIAFVAGWFHDSASVAPFYGGAEGVDMRLLRARAAAEAWIERQELITVPAYAEGDERAGMFFRMDYYADPDRGAVRAWSNEMAEMTWLHWLTFDGIAAARRLRIPTLFVHGDECALPDNVRQIQAEVPGSELVWKPGFQADYYDLPDLTAMSVAAATAHFRRHLAK